MVMPCEVARARGACMLPFRLVAAYTCPSLGPPGVCGHDVLAIPWRRLWAE
jgi:hypothetical protein